MRYSLKIFYQFIYYRSISPCWLTITALSSKLRRGGAGERREEKAELHEDEKSRKQIQTDRKGSDEAPRQTGRCDTWDAGNYRDEDEGEEDKTCDTQDEEAVREGRRSSSSMWTPAVIKVWREKSREDEHKLRHKSQDDTTLNAASGEKNGKKGLIVS